MSDHQLIADLGFDKRFHYPNVQITRKYHIVEQGKPKRDIMRDYNPVIYSRHGMRGLNFTKKYDDGTNEIVVSNYDSRHKFREIP